jgi:hypothetical protein
MNVFVLCAGRCGSTTFAKACSHLTNFSAAHESRSSLLGRERLDYPANHIEIDNRLSWLLGRLDERYGDEAFYVHLWRDRAAVAESFVRRYGGGIIKAYRGSGIIMGLPESSEPVEVCSDYCHTVDSNIRLFLKDKSRKMDFRLDDWRMLFPVFCEHIGARGDISVCLAEFEVKHNASRNEL